MPVVSHTLSFVALARRSVASIWECLQSIPGNSRNTTVVDKIEVYWPLDDKFYPVSISEYKENTGKQKIAYDDGQTENLNMKNETLRILQTNQA